MGSGSALGTNALDGAADATIAAISAAHQRQKPYTNVCVHSDIRAAEAAWAALERIAPISGYQLRRWLIPWIETVGRSNGYEPMLVIAEDNDSQPVAMLPFAVVRSGPLHRAVFLGGRDANFNMGLFRPGPAWSRNNVSALLREAAAASRRRIDIYDLRNQPRSWKGVENPLAKLPSLPSPSFSAFGRLGGDADLFLSGRTSADSRKKLRKKARRLAQHVGEVRYVQAQDAASAHAILEAFRLQKSARLRALGLADLFADRSLMAFLDRGATETIEAPAVELHALCAGSRIVATFGGTEHDKRFSGMFISFDDDIEVARSSPGDLLLRHVVAAKCATGCEAFDLGIGEALYKASYCDEVEPLFDAMVPVNPLGVAAALVLGLRVRAKRLAKQTPWMWKLVRSLRKLRRHA